MGSVEEGSCAGYGASRSVNGRERAAGLQISRWEVSGCLVLFDIGEARRRGGCLGDCADRPGDGSSGHEVARMVQGGGVCVRRGAPETA